MKIPVENQSDYYSNFNEALAQFSPDFKEKCQKSAYAHAIMEQLARGVTPYTILEQMIQQMEDNQAIVKRVLENSPTPFHNVFQR